MAKTRLAPSESSRSAAAVVAARASAADAKGSINLRIETGTRQLIDDAAAVLTRFANGSLGLFESTRYARGHKALKTFELNGADGSVM